MPFGPYYSSLPVDGGGKRYVDQTSFDAVIDNFVNWKGNVNGGGYTLWNVSISSSKTTIGISSDNGYQFQAQGSGTFGDSSSLNPARINPAGFSYGGVVVGGASPSTFYALSVGGGNRNAGQYVGMLTYHGFGPSAGLNTSLGARIAAVSDNSASTDYGCHLDFETVKSSSAPGAASGVRVRITSGGRVGINKLAPNSNLAVVGLPVYADNAAALSGGLTAGDFYRTSAGQSMVTY